MKNNQNLRIFPIIALSLKNKKKIKLFSKLEKNINYFPERDYVHVWDVIKIIWFFTKPQFKERFVRFGKFRYKDYHIIDKFKEFIELLDIGNSNVIDVINEELNILVDQVQSKDELSEEEQRIQEIEEEEINEGI